MIEGYVAKLNSCETFLYIPIYLILIKDIPSYQYTHMVMEFNV